VILFPGRTGSTFLVSALDAHPKVEAKGEVLDGLRAEGVDAQRAWVDRYLRGPVVGRSKVIGFKTKLRDVLDKEAFTAAVERYNTQIIVLDRRNDVKHAVSRITARVLRDRTGRWNRYEGSAGLGLIEIDPEDFASRLSAVEEEKGVIRSYVAGLDRPHLYIDYEDLCADPPATFEKVFKYLGVASLPVAGVTLKNTSDDLREVISNFDALRKLYAGTPYEAMFADQG
jgi:LPS sulfotransferase NodH